MKRAVKIKLNLIMIIIFCLFPKLAQADDLSSKINNYCYDELSILDENTKENIKNTNKELQNKTGSQILVLTLNNPNGMDAMSYGSDLFNQLEIGDKDKDNGVLILFLENKDDKKRQIAIIPGYGLEGRLNDGKVGRIIDDFMMDDFKKGDYSKGINQGFSAVVSQVAEEYQVDLTGDYESYQKELDQDDGFNPFYVFFMIIIFIIIANRLSRFRSFNRTFYGQPRNTFPSWFGRGFWDDDDDDFPFSGWSSGGGFSGSGFSGGGGSTGGGGASRSF